MAGESPTLVAVQNGERVGFAIVQILRTTSHLAAIVVAETARGTGVGAALLHASERLARHRGSSLRSTSHGPSQLARRLDE